MESDPISMLIDGAIQYEVLQNKNQYLTLETIILRVYRKIFEYTRVAYYQFDKTILFSQWHDEILNAYELLKSNMSHEERASVERVLSKDCPHPTELSKFACCWYKHEPTIACKWFAVDGIIGTHPKVYVHDAFSTNFEKHNTAVRALYSYYNNPEQIKQIVGTALEIQQENPFEFDADMDRCVGLYVEMVGKKEMERIKSDRLSKLLAQQQPNKRKRKNQTQEILPVDPQPISPVDPQPISPVDSPQNL